MEVQATIREEAAEQTIPEVVVRAIAFHAERLKEIGASLANVQRARGTGHILSQELKDRSPAIAGAFNELTEIHDLAINNAELVNFERLIEMHVLPDFTMFGYPKDELPNWLNRSVHEKYIMISADNITGLRQVDVYRVISEVRTDNIDRVTRRSLASWIASRRPDLVGEVQEVLSELGS